MGINRSLRWRKLVIFKVIWSPFVAQVLRSSYIFGNTASTVIRSLADQTHRRIESGLPARTCTAYTVTFKLFLVFLVYIRLSPLYTMDTIVLFLEFLAQKNLNTFSLRNNVSVLKHFFPLFYWPVMAWSSA